MANGGAFRLAIEDNREIPDTMEVIWMYPNNTLVIQVMVTRERSRGLADQTGSTERLKDEARIVSIKTRKAQ